MWVHQICSLKRFGFGYLEAHIFPSEFYYQSVYFNQNGSWDFNMDCVESADQLGNCHLNKIKFSNSWTWISLHLFRSSLISFHISWFSAYMSYICFLNFIHGYFILFDAIADGITFLNLFLGCSLLYHRNPIEFSILDLTACNFADLIY